MLINENILKNLKIGLKGVKENKLTFDSFAKKSCELTAGNIFESHPRIKKTECGYAWSTDFPDKSDKRKVETDTCGLTVRDKYGKIEKIKWSDLE